MTELLFWIGACGLALSIGAPLVYLALFDPTDVTVDGKTASVDSIKVYTSLKEPLVVVKEDRVTLILPSRDYFTSQANR